jgi:hypothetical protein
VRPHVVTHAELLTAIQLAYSHGETRLLRANVGQGWTGNIVFQDRARIVLSPYRAFHGMREGVLDLIGFSGPTFVAVDAKTGRDRLRPAQRIFIDLVLACGGRAGDARSVEDAGKIIRGE